MCQQNAEQCANNGNPPPKVIGQEILQCAGAKWTSEHPRDSFSILELVQYQFGFSLEVRPESRTRIRSADRWMPSRKVVNALPPVGLTAIRPPAKSSGKASASLSKRDSQEPSGSLSSIQPGRGAGNSRSSVSEMVLRSQAETLKWRSARSGARRWRGSGTTLRCIYSYRCNT